MTGYGTTSSLPYPEKSEAIIELERRIDELLDQDD